jgi:hypothetical protein
MLDLCFVGITEKLIIRIHKLEKVNLQTDHIVGVLDGFMIAAPHNIVARFRNAGISLLLDSDRVIRCVMTAETARRLLGTPFSGAMPIPEDEEDGENPDIREYVDQADLRFVDRGECDGGA